MPGAFFWRMLFMASTTGGPLTAEGEQNIALGIGLMLLATFVYSVNDVLGKWLVGTYSVGQILLFRSIAACTLLMPIVGRAGPAPFRDAPRPWLQVLGWSSARAR